MILVEVIAGHVMKCFVMAFLLVEEKRRKKENGHGKKGFFKHWS